MPRLWRLNRNYQDHINGALACIRCELVFASNANCNKKEKVGQKIVYWNLYLWYSILESGHGQASIRNLTNLWIPVYPP